MTNKICVALFVGLAALILTACSSGTSKSTSEAENLLNAYIAAYEAKDTEQILSLFSEDAMYMDQGDPKFRGIGEVYVRQITTAWAQTFQEPQFQVKFESYFISSDGTHAALKTVYNDRNANGNPISVPMIIILEIKNGKIVREEDYYDSSPFE